MQAACTMATELWKDPEFESLRKMDMAGLIRGRLVETEHKDVLPNTAAAIAKWLLAGGVVPEHAKKPGRGKGL